MNRDEKWLLEEKYNGVATPEYEADKARLAGGEPLAYVIGSIPFLGLTIHLDSHPLIPRPETEWWTEQMLNQLAEGRKQRVSQTTSEGTGQAVFEPLRSSTERAGGNSSADEYSVFKNRLPGARTMLDLCAGSGAIGCAMLARAPEARVFFGELTHTHEPTILKNIRENKLDESRASVRIGDLFEPFKDMRFDLIAINPPYVPSGRLLPLSVTRYEPPEALYAGDDGLELIRRIASELPQHLTPTGTAWIECDRDHAKEAEALFTAQGLTARLCNDQYGIPRVIVCRHTSARSAQ